MPTATPTPTFTPSPPAFAPGALLISEFMANPDAVGDSDGEWIELVNVSADAIPLHGWSLHDEGTNSFAITATLVIAPGQYLVLVRNPDAGVNGGIIAAEGQRYAGFDLANPGDEIILVAPDGTEIDRVVWGVPDGAPVTAGASTERTSLAADAPWTTATAPWPGSAGDFGSPGAAYAAPTATPVIPVDTPTPTVTPTPVAPATPLPPVRINEFMANPAAVDDDAGEWIELVSAHDQPVNLNGWSLADLGGDLHVITVDLWLEPGGLMVLVRNEDPLQNGGVTGAYRYTGVSLANGDDEIILRGPNGEEADRVVWGVPDGAPVTAGASTQRRPDGSWEIATQLWPGSAGDAGSPGATYVPPPATSTPTPTATLTPTAAAPATPTPTAPLPAWSPTPGPPPPIKLSEVMIDPAAASDGDGEWIELFNPTAREVNLRGWTLADLGTDAHVIATDVTVAPGGYVVLGRNDDTAVNGNVPVAYIYTGVSLANGDDELLLIAPDGSVMDELAWGDGTLFTAPNGASLARISPTGAAWTPSLQRWPGSAGDHGSPGAAYVPVTPTPTTPPILVPTATPTPAPPATPDVPPWTGPLPALRISEFLADPAAVADSAGEWVELHNAGATAVNLRGWILADLGDDRHVIAQDLMLAPGAYVVLGRNSAMAENGGVVLDYVYSGISLGNDEDELLLLAPGDREVDRVIWGTGSVVDVARGRSTQRRPGGAGWAVSTTPWPGSAGDMGTPGTAFSAPVQATPTPLPGRNPDPIVPSTPTPAPTVTWTGPVPPVYISEVLANPDAVADSDGEWIE
ncbi:MAG: lamin tail domain-containing protein, partial [Caldilineaceae bacterium]|nr:lamin tail domain-containing protein [Caldilineaceae bacterium]